MTRKITVIRANVPREIQNAEAEQIAAKRVSFAPAVNGQQIEERRVSRVRQILQRFGIAKEDRT